LLEEEERLGADISTSASMDTTAVGLTALSANLAPSLVLLADVVRHPAFGPAEVARVKAQRQARLAQTMQSPQGLAMRAINPLLFGPGHPYAAAQDGLGSAESLAALTPEALRAAHGQWLRPDLARITVVGDITMAELLPQLEAAFGKWAAPPPQAGEGDRRPAPAPHARIVLIDRPGSPQSFILGGQVLPISGREDKAAPARRRRWIWPIRCWAAISSRGSTPTCARKRAGPMACRPACAARWGSAACWCSRPCRPTAPAIRSRPSWPT
jgi:predicted Zn-dependent peptidase